MRTVQWVGVIENLRVFGSEAIERNRALTGHCLSCGNFRQPPGE